MPTVNIYNSNNSLRKDLVSIASDLRIFIASELSCDQRQLDQSEISIRLISVNNLAMTAPMEVEIKAHAYEQRVKQSDQICLKVQTYLKEQIPMADNIRVWLALSELGHSWEE